MFKKTSIAAALLTALSGFSTVAYADTQGNTLANFLMSSTVTGQVRAYYFTRNFGGDAPTLSAFSLGGYINAHTASLAGFSADVGFYTANSLGANNTATNSKDAFLHLDSTLMGAGNSINALGQAYLQYEIPHALLIRAGNQIVNTPWVNSSDSRIIPATFQGIFAQVSPYSGWNIYGMRMFRWKSRTSEDYTRDNLYYPATFDGDAMDGGEGGLTSKGNPPASNGLLAFGTSYKRYGINAQAWYYDMYQFTNILYGDAQYTLKTGSGIDPFVGAQLNREWESNSLLNSSLGASNINGFVGNGVNSTAWGVIGGVGYNLDNAFLGKGELAASYNEIVYNAGAVGGGAIISPYTAGYATDPLYTTSMTRGLVETGPGHAWRVKWTQHFLGKQFLFSAAYTQFQLQTEGSANDIYGDLIYFPKGWVKGLSIRDRVDLAHGDLSSAQGGYFLYNRVMLTYAF